MCVVSTAIRFYVRIRVQKEFGWDDGFLIFGLCSLVASVALTHVILDSMYMTEALVFGHIQIAFTFDLVKQALFYRKVSAAALTLMWFSICSVKFSFLALFKRLIRQRPGMIKFWWLTLAFNILVTVYGATVYTASCPYFREDQILKACKLLSDLCKKKN